MRIDQNRWVLQITKRYSISSNHNPPPIFFIKKETSEVLTQLDMPRFGSKISRCSLCWQISPYPGPLMITNMMETHQTITNPLLLDIDCSSFLSFCFDISACWPSKLTSTSTVFWCVRIETESFTSFLLLILRIEVIAWTKCLGDSVFPPEQKHGGP